MKQVVLAALGLALGGGQAFGGADAGMALSSAALNDDVAQIRLLVARGAEVDDRFLGMTPLCVTVGNDGGEHLASVRALLQAGADPNAECGPAERTPLHEAALDGDIDTVKLLLAAGAKVNARNRFGRTPLFYALHPPAPLRAPPNSAAVARAIRAAGGSE